MPNAAVRPIDPDEMVDPYAASLATAYHLAMPHSEHERTLERLFREYCCEENIDGDALLESIGARIEIITVQGEG